MRRALRCLVLAGFCCTSARVDAVAPSFPGVTGATVTFTEGEVPIPDNASVVAVLNVDLPGRIIDVDVTLSIAHDTPDQLDVYLVSPSGTTVTLTTDNGQGNDDVFQGVTFDDQAPPRDRGTPESPDPNANVAAHVRNVTYEDGVPIGRVQPEGALAAMVGDPAKGPWALVVVDDSGGTTGVLESWSMAISTLSALPSATTASFDGPGAEIPDGSPKDAINSPVTVAGLGRRVLDADVTVRIAHPRSGQLDVFLTSPSGTRIELVTNVGGNARDLYLGTVFDDSAPLPVSDMPLPEVDGDPFVAVVPEGALGAFLGEDPNGNWVLTVGDRAFGNVGELLGWTLTLTATAGCGDGVVDPGEECDDGNGTNGDGCDVDCTISRCGNGQVGGDEQCDDGNVLDGDACSSTCQLPETACDDCVDNDGDGLVDMADPGCGAAPLDLKRVTLVERKGATGLVVKAAGVAAGAGAGPLQLLIADGNGVVACAVVGDARVRGKKVTAKGVFAGGSIAAILTGKRGGTLALKGKGLRLDALDDPALTVGLRVGGAAFVGRGTLRAKGSRRTLP
ncbi:MAG: proprotein convertase P-domain-containing protein [bacterium]|nr:proprotein convertase P-domain-containing protein [bacterium]